MINELIKQADDLFREKEETILCSFIKEMIPRFAELKQVQPKLTRVYIGMGTWSFGGEVEGYYIEEEEEGISTWKAGMLDDYIAEGSNVCHLDISDRAAELVTLLNYFVDDLNASTVIDGIDENGVIYDDEEPIEYSSFENKLKDSRIKIKWYKTNI